MNKPNRSDSRVGWHGRRNQNQPCGRRNPEKRAAKPTQRAPFGPAAFCMLGESSEFRTQAGGAPQKKNAATLAPTRRFRETSGRDGSPSLPAASGDKRLFKTSANSTGFHGRHCSTPRTFHCSSYFWLTLKYLLLLTRVCPGPGPERQRRASNPVNYFRVWAF